MFVGCNSLPFVGDFSLLVFADVGLWVGCGFFARFHIHDGVGSREI